MDCAIAFCAGLFVGGIVAFVAMCVVAVGGGDDW